MEENRSGHKELKNDILFLKKDALDLRKDLNEHRKNNELHIVKKRKKAS